MRFGSVCSGIEAASVAWHPLGWQAAWLSEIEPFPCAVLAHHYPAVPNLGDMTTLAARVLAGEVEAPELLCGGTPCQAFSVAGLRRSLDDARGNLSLSFCDLADAIDAARAAAGAQPSIILWENVVGVLNTKDNAFGCFLGALAGENCALQPSGGKWTDAGCVLGPQRAIAWRVLDAQYFGLAQRRRRVFVVASARNGFDPAAVLFESEGVRRDSPPSRETREGAAARATDGAGIPRWPADVASTLNAAFGDKQGLEDQHALSGAPLFVPAEPTAFNPTQDPITPTDGTTHAIGCGSKGGQARIAIAFSAKDYGAGAAELSPTLRAMGHAGSHANGGGQSEDGTGRGAGAVAIRTAQTGSNGWGINTEGTAYTLDSAQQAVSTGMAVRRLTPRECERLQGFSDDYTAIPWRGKPASECPDGPRYKALGNSWAVPCVRRIGARIEREVLLS